MKRFRVDLRQFDDYGRRKKKRRKLIISIMVCIIMIAFGTYWVFKEKSEPPVIEKETVQATLPRMANLPPKNNIIEPPSPPSYPSDAPLLEQARSALRDEVEADEAVALARSLPEHPERADAAFLLLEYAADSGNPEAALAVGQYYDPVYKGPCGSIRKNPAEAYEWYQEAIAGGLEKARAQLANLRLWVEEQAEQGSGEARNLLKIWQ